MILKMIINKLNPSKKLGDIACFNYIFNQTIPVDKIQGLHFDINDCAQVAGFNNKPSGCHATFCASLSSMQDNHHGIVRGVVVIIGEGRHGDPSSNPGRGCLQFTCSILR